jgi:hypothetical protein
MDQHEVNYRTILTEKEERPQFERMISDIERARKHWDRPGLRDYGRVLLKIVGEIALKEAGNVVADVPGVKV